MTDDSAILATSASLWAALERHLKSCGMLDDAVLNRERAHCINLIIDALRGDQVIPAPPLPLLVVPPIVPKLDDSAPVQPRRALNLRGLSETEAARWNKYLDRAVHGYSGDDEVEYGSK